MLSTDMPTVAKPTGVHMMFVRDEVARQLISQHIRECEIARNEDRQDRMLTAAEVARKLETQNTLVEKMHEQNLARFKKLDDDANARFLKLMWTIVVVLLTALSGLALEFVKGPHIGG